MNMIIFKVNVEMSVDVRIQIAEDLGVGISLWELGQGLDYMYELF